MTRIHLDLIKVKVSKTDIDKITFGLFKYAHNKNLLPPYLFTATTSTTDVNYLGVLKNNGVQLIDEMPNDVSIIFDGADSNPSSNDLMMMSNMPAFSKISVSRACTYVDWDNIQVSVDRISDLFKGMASFIHSTKVHVLYNFYVFLHTKTAESVRAELKRCGAVAVSVVKDKSKNNDAEMLNYMRRNTSVGDSVCVASGDRDFSSLMVEYVRNYYNVLLVYNKQAIYTFKTNKHWLNSIDINALLPKTLLTDTIRRSPKSEKTKPCKFYNLNSCSSIECNFLHVCGACGRDHRIVDFHAAQTSIKTTICKKYNEGKCKYNQISCEHLHMCARCKRQHAECDSRRGAMFCPVCDVTLKTSKEYVLHLMDEHHVNRMDMLKKILTDVRPSNHILVV